ncbi:MAG: acyl-CoA thioesterase [Gemmatimonadales bacterium]|nr:MAG: acyl-CoA thioesterase [Gemmatimonadales bacterium]
MTFRELTTPRPEDFAMRPDHEPSDTQFHFEHRVPVRFRDIDVGGHAHHSQALVYMEEARTQYWGQVASVDDPARIDYILAEALVRYHERILYPDLLRVQVRTTAVGRTSFELEYRVLAGDGRLLASGRTTMVLYDYTEGRSRRIPDELRARFEAFEGRNLPRRRERDA